MGGVVPKQNNNGLSCPKASTEERSSPEAPWRVYCSWLIKLLMIDTNVTGITMNGRVSVDTLTPG